ncbi:hypothetical protein IW139_003372 [Coemansia sp. RSA 353]|nr:hypothetical protein GGF48_005417 [Coemansia sp. RSA 921]KAJ2135601.1 hypothetical protein GGH17_002310 [Coemansia sp. RSA 788]KAJ2145669.1 hypothetical protein IW142_002487 [Coemansia sp. RSA 564]KAJ2296408.1 hypothetical protein IW139_003372 [Coemansia sp. RSA 353]KAJ2555786.1 hypothetical protein IWW35_000466 [Coemansia sp. RSA 1878]KAJ2588076.1 hypothetical protein IWW49_003158 [Coemansia sp. RSA 1797]KAJ2833694.1 hypothetical protein J3B01_004287 [Coemansia erecta]
MRKFTPLALRLCTAHRSAFSVRTITSTQSKALVSTRDDIEYCRRLVHKHDYETYLSSLFSPRYAREALWGLRALNIELLTIPTHTRTPSAISMRYAFWHNTIMGLYTQPQTQNLPPVARVLHDAIQRSKISRTWLRRLISERQTSTAINTLDDLQKHGERTIACLIHAHLESLNVRNMHADNAARAIGVSSTISHMLRSMPEQLAHGRCDLPRDILAKHNINVQELYKAPKNTPELQNAVYEVATTAYTKLCGVAELHIPNSPRQALPALLVAVPVKMWLERLEHANFDVFDPRLRQTHAVHVMWKLWKARRKGTWLDVSNQQTGN